MDFRHALARITVPALVAVGDQDRVTPPAVAVELAAALPDGPAVHRRGCGPHRDARAARAAQSRAALVRARGPRARHPAERREAARRERRDAGRWPRSPPRRPAARSAGSPEGRTQVVFGVGNAGRGRDVHRRGARLPRGQAGRAVRRRRRPAAEPDAGGDLGLRREDVYIGNVVKCRPPGNRDPLPGRDRGLHAVARRADLVLHPARDPGDARQLRDPVRLEQTGRCPSAGFAASRFSRHGRTVIPTFHPAAILHGGRARAPASSNSCARTSR